jgi:hypothetical protein
MASLELDLSSSWSMKTTSELANFDIILHDKVEDNSLQEFEDLQKDLHTISLAQYNNVAAYEPYHLYDRLFTLLAALSNVHATITQDQFWGIIQHNNEYFKEVINFIANYIMRFEDSSNKQVVGGSEMDYANHMYTTIHGGTKESICPVLLTTKYALEIRHFQALTYILGGLCFDPERLKLVEELLNNGWHGRLSKADKLFGLEWNLYHPGTYVNLADLDHGGTVLFQVRQMLL